MPLLLRRFLSPLFLVCLCVSMDAQVEKSHRANTVIPKGVILVKGAEPAASDSTTPVPEDGRIVEGHYRNGYLGISYPIPEGWSEQPAGPPPSDSGNYVLTQLALIDREEQRVKANVLITAQDLFFSPLPVASAGELVKTVRRNLGPDYEVERGPDEVTIGGRKFARFAYKSSLAGLHWRILSTDVRCHAFTFSFTGTDTKALDAAERGLKNISLDSPPADAPQCINGYASDENVLEKIDPHFSVRRFNSIPVRVIIDREGRVKHVHLLSAFPDQSNTIIAALRQWRFKPYLRDGKPAEVETGIVFGIPRTIVRLPGR